MRYPALSVLLAVLMICAASRRGLADNPTIRLKLKRVNAWECAEAIARAAKTYVEVVPTVDEVPAEPGPYLLKERGDFDWSQAITLANALRQVCDRYRLTPSRVSGSYRLSPEINNPAPLEEPLGIFVGNGCRVYTEGHSLNNWKVGAVQHDLDGTFSIDVRCGLGEGGGDQIAGIDNVRALDDRGASVPVIRLADAGLVPASALYPDEWKGLFSVSGLDSRAKALRWVVGDLMIYKVCKRHRCTFDLPITPNGQSRELSGIKISVDSLRTGIVGPDPRQNGAASLQARIRVPPGGALLFSDGMSPNPALVGVSGKEYRQGSFSFGPDEDGGPESHLIGRYSPIREPVVKVVFDFVERRQRVKLVHFKMKDIPLPPGPTSQAENLQSRRIQ